MGELETKFGELLKLERERQGKSLDYISQTLRIPDANLRAIEAGNVDALPTPIYFGLFAKTYAELLGIDYSATIEAIREDMADRESEVEVKKPKKDKPSNGREPTKATGPAKEKDKGQEAHREDPEREAERQPVKKRSKRLLIGLAIAALVILVGGYLVVTQLFSDTGIGRTLSGSRSGESAEEAAYSNYNWSVPRYQPSDSLRLTLRSRGDSWATILADGDTALFRNLLPGETYSVSAQYRMLMSVAVPSLVDIELNGRPVDPSSPETGRISRVEINQANLDSVFTASHRDTTGVLNGSDTVQSSTTPSSTTTAGGI